MRHRFRKYFEGNAILVERDSTTRFRTSFPPDKKVNSVEADRKREREKKERGGRHENSIYTIGGRREGRSSSMIDRLRIYNSHAFVNGCCESWLGRNETDEGGSMHVRRMAKDLCRRMKTFSTLRLPTLLACVISSSLPLFIFSHSFLPLLLYLLISLHLRSFSSWLASLLPSPPLLPLSLCLQSYRLYKKKLSAKFFFSTSFLFPLSFLPFFVSYSSPLPSLLSLFLFILITNGITDDSEIFARTICSSVRTRSWNVSALIKGTASLQLPELTSFANTSVFSGMSFFLSSFFSFFFYFLFSSPFFLLFSFFHERV